ncbi:MAG TPA: Gfo/Idh/MocA family oxidoreductase [Candidatus Sumerlaeota bacterium]|nr:Gfo/Idh/MocA family oxidoreductase [Candidatus Sumerlaeota bacterium]HPK00871.1 Gfo/Idh/MocA family oxidoreductase [Candidatus Sumerlaeota bacterium]
MSKVKVALIGAGGMANTVHYPSLTTMDDVEITGLCDLNEQRLKETAAKFKIGKTFTDWRKMLDETKPAAVYVLMPPHHLFDIAMEALERGHHLFIEKPPAVTTFQADCLARMAEKKKLISGVGFQRRYHPLVRRCWEEVKKKGPVHQVNSCFYKDLPPQDKHPYYGGAIDILHCDAIHAVDSLRYYAGLSEVKAVASEVRTIDSWYAVSFNSLVYFENDCVGILQANWRTGRRFFKFELHAPDASAYLDIDAEGVVWTDNGAEPTLKLTNTEAAQSQEFHVFQGFFAQSRAFIDAVASGKPLHNDLRDSVKSMELVDLIYQNAINKKCCR